MPPEQCPECGRFLKNSLVEALTDAPAPCPGCAIELTADMFANDEPAVPAVGPDRVDGDGAASVRPPDLAPEAVRDGSLDVLAGWDIGADDAEVAAWRRDTRPPPVDTAVVGGGLLVGAVAGALAWRDHRVWGAGIGAFAGVVVAGAARRIWRLEA